VIVLDAAEADDSGAAPVVPYASLLSTGLTASPPPAVSISPSDIVVLPYSSGTSGKPKGVMLSHSNLNVNLLQLEPTQSSSFKGQKVLGLLPFFHIYGMVVVMSSALRLGGTVVTMPKFDPPVFLDIMKRESINIAHVAPPLMVFLAKHPAVESILPLPHLNDMLCAAAPLGEDLGFAVLDRFSGSPDLAIRQGYGMTELSPASHVVPPGADKSKMGSVGWLLPGMRCKLVDTETGEMVGVGEEGEITLQGPNVMKGYLNRPDATAECLDAEGWLRTGDVGKVDEEGYWYIVDRVKELIKTKGFQVAPAELEALLNGWERIADAAVIGIADDRAGELPKAFVVKQAGHEALTEQEVLEFVKPRVAPYKQLAAVEFIDAVPKSPAGKILRRVLRAQ